jgi:hypothetical protein
MKKTPPQIYGNAWVNDRGKGKMIIDPHFFYPKATVDLLLMPSVLKVVSQRASDSQNKERRE